MSDNMEGIKMVRIAAGQLHSLCPQVSIRVRNITVEISIQETFISQQQIHVLSGKNKKIILLGVRTKKSFC